MASERIGVACEAVVAAVCDSVLVKKEWRIEHEPTENDLLVAIPDFKLTNKLSAKTVYLQVTYAGAKPDSQRKFWRNLGELQELKARRGSECRVLSITFGSAYLNYIPPVYRVAWDGGVFADAVHPDLIRIVRDAASRKKLDFSEKTDYICRKYHNHPALRGLARVLLRILGQRDSSHTLWDSHGEESRARLPVQPRLRITTIRRGVAKMLLARPPCGLLEKPVNIEQESLSQLVALRVVRPSFVGPVLADAEAHSAIAALGTEMCRKMLGEAPMERLRGWLDVIWHTADVIAAAVSWVDILQGRSYQAMYDKLVEAAEGNHPNQLEYVALFELIKGAAGKRQAVGAREQLLRGIEQVERNSRTFDVYRSLLGYDVVLRDHETIRLGLQSVLSPGGSQKFSLVRSDLARVAVCIVERYASLLTDETVKNAIRSMKEEVFSTYFDVKVATYRHFDPLLTLLRETLSGEGIRFDVGNIRSAFADECLFRGVKLDPRSTATRVLITETGVIINWQSATVQGRDHKRKELCGRAPAIRYEWNAEGQVYQRRGGVNKLCLVLDGEWREGDLRAMLEAGWDEIYYPDEMDMLVKSLV